MTHAATTRLALSLMLTGILAFCAPADAWAKKKTDEPKPVEQPTAAEAIQPERTPEQTAIQAYNEGVELFQIAQIQAEKGNANGQKKLLKESIVRFEQALKANPSLTEAQSNIGFAYLTLHDYRNAVKAFEKALTVNPNHLNTLNGLSTAYAFQGDLENALATFDKLTTLDPGNSQYFFNKGSVLQKAGRVEDARQAYEQALKVRPDDQRALFNMGTLLENQGKLEEAIPFYEKAKGVEIGNPIGLEAINRIQFIERTLNARAQSESQPSQ